LARSFRYYGKKRGHRRTGSPTLASAAEAVFFAALVLLGCGGLLWALHAIVVSEWRVNHEFVETTCKVLEKQIGKRSADDGGTLYRPEIKIQYEVGGVEYKDPHYDIRQSCFSSREDAQAALDAFELYSVHQRTYPCWYDPAHPDVAVLVRGSSWATWLVFTVPISLILIGAGGLVYTLLHWGKSAERRAAGAGGNGNRWPFVPQGADMTNSPGTRLKFRLPMATSPGWALFGTFAFCILWNGVVAVLAIVVVRGLVVGKPGLLLPALILVPLAAVGVWALVVLAHRLWTTTGIGPTLVEISDHPLRPGRQYHVFLSQSGRLTMHRLQMHVVCEEVATYRQGTDTRTETREVYGGDVFRGDNFEIRGGMPFEADVELSVPRQAMHSFAAEHNEIHWTLVVEGNAAGWPAFRRAFPVIVCPPHGEIDP
jgi:hypothetical protein